jgi:hypothetical protein
VQIMSDVKAVARWNGYHNHDSQDTRHASGQRRPTITMVSQTGMARRTARSDSCADYVSRRIMQLVFVTVC